MKSEIKEFKVLSGKICVTDPCYSRGTWCANFDIAAKNGKWITFVEFSDEGDWGSRVATLYAFHEKYNYSEIRDNCMLWTFLEKEIGVDSGQAGIFDSKIYPDGKEMGDYEDLTTFYGAACAASAPFGIVQDRGVVSSSGFGDGGYQGFQIVEKGKVVGVKIEFITEEDGSEKDYV